MHLLHMVFPQGSVTGSLKGYEHRAHCTSLTICRASLEAFNGSVGEGVVEEEVLWSFGNVVRNGREAVLSGMEDIEALRPAGLGLVLQILESAKAVVVPEGHYKIRQSLAQQMCSPF